MKFSGDNSGSRSVLGQSGYTLLELLVTFAIIAILAGMGVVSLNKFRERAKKAQCISKMRTIHVALAAHLGDHGRWPQMPKEVVSFEETEFFGWWVDVLGPYGISQENWLCPSDTKMHNLPPGERTGSYIPMLFDAKPMTPLMHATQPWLMERGNLHGKGAHVAMPDGSINSSSRAFR